MRPVRPILERLVARAVESLPAAETGRNSWGVRWFRWASPCEEIEALWLSVTAQEVVLSCRLAHTHFSRDRYHRERLTNLRLKRRIARDAIQEARRFMSGRVAVVIDAGGTSGSSMWCPLDQLLGAMEHSRQVFGGTPQRAWVWSGAVAC